MSCSAICFQLTSLTHLHSFWNVTLKGSWSQSGAGVGKPWDRSDRTLIRCPSTQNWRRPPPSESSGEKSLLGGKRLLSGSVDYFMQVYLNFYSSLPVSYYFYLAMFFDRQSFEWAYRGLFHRYEDVESACLVASACSLVILQGVHLRSYRREDCASSGCVSGWQSMGKEWPRHA